MNLKAAIFSVSIVLFGALASTADGPPEASEPLDPGSLASMISALFGNEPPTEEELASIAAKAATHPLGSRGNPIRASGARGQHAYILRLNCPGGSKPAYHRAGSAGVGIYGNILDIYVVTCPKGPEAALYLDLYHSGYVEAGAVPGFTIDPPPK
ncbi:hypothetical protein [Hyphomonas sp.]|uniref:hypothetical protein n=1 Tax=Hyphomonas sp. TaxID=87 RepID=UPI00391C96F8